MYSSAKAFLKGGRFCFVCDKKLGRNESDKCRGMASGKCSMKDNPQAVALPVKSKLKIVKPCRLHILAA
jgi:hypothetical protein